MATKGRKEVYQVDDDYVSPDVVQNYIDKFHNMKGSDADRFASESLDWFRRTISKTSRHSQTKFLNAPYGKKTGTERTQLIGKLYFFQYKAEQAGDLDLGVYDQFPMIFVYGSSRSKEGNTILHGLNIHYLLPKERQLLLEQLLKIKSTATMRKNTRIKASWETIKAVADSTLYSRAVHSYRIDRFQSRMVEIPAPDWSAAVFLNLQNWVSIDPDAQKYQSAYRKRMRDRALRQQKRK